jgi:NhaP-type Na+/H+ or K+/H+ antiporter
MIQRLLTLGVLVTWLGTAALIWVTFQLSVSYSLLAASLVVVTGPTVIVPLLKRIQATLKVSTILHWEGVLIDAIGVFLALLCFEWVIGNQGGQAIANFGLRVIIGLAVGALGGWLIQASLKKRLIPENLINGYVLAGGVLIFGLTESFLTEAGLLAVTVAGLVIGWKQPVELKEIRAFKAEITDLLIGLLFILLVSRLEIQQFIDFGWRGAILVGLVMLLVRPLSVFLCSLGTDLKLREKVFLSWVAPRGVVAASMASLFAISLSGQGDNSAAVFLETFTYSVICGTVLIQGFSAGFVAHLLKLRRPEAINWLIVGANIFGRQLGKIIQAEAKTEVFSSIPTREMSPKRGKRDSMPTMRMPSTRIIWCSGSASRPSVTSLPSRTISSSINCSESTGSLMSDDTRHTPGDRSLPPMSISPDAGEPPPPPPWNRSGAFSGTWPGHRSSVANWNGLNP